MLPQKTQISSDWASYRLLTTRLKYSGWKHSNNFNKGERELRGGNYLVIEKIQSELKDNEI